MAKRGRQCRNMGRADSPLAVLSAKHQPLIIFLKQLLRRLPITIDAIRGGNRDLHQPQSGRGGEHPKERLKPKSLRWRTHPTGKPTCQDQAYSRKPGFKVRKSLLPTTRTRLGKGH